jgi:amidase
MIKHRMLRSLPLVAAIALSWSSATAARPPAKPLAAPKPLSALADDLAAKRTTSVALVTAFQRRIAQIDRKGPAINAVLILNPNAMAQAKALDDERRAGKLRGPLHGIPILIKDNIETLDPMPTTAGSLALKDNLTGRDAPLVAKLRAAGAIILGKTNLSEWANMRSTKSTSGWSAVGGQTHNPFILDHNPCGSSSGSGAGMAAGLAAGTVGTETDGSIVCPASVNGVVGFKPSVGLVSRTHVVPISHSQDTPGPITLTVRDAAMMLSAMAGSDPADPATAEADAHSQDFTSGLNAGALKGVRLGIMTLPGTATPLFTAALARLRKAGAVLVPVAFDQKQADAAGEAEFKVLLTELKADMAAYLGSLPAPSGRNRSLADLVAFNKAHAAQELAHFGQEHFEAGDKQKGLDDPEYIAALATSRRLSGPEGIDKMMRDNKVALLIAQTNGPAWRTTLGKGDKFIGPSISQPPAVAGYPHLSVPIGLASGLPIGLSFIGGKWDDALVLNAGYAFEVAGPSLRPTPKYLTTKAAKRPKASRSARP